MGKLYLRVAEEAERRGYNKLKLSKETGLDYQTIQRMWDNQIKRLDFGSLEIIAKTLHVKTRDLIGEGPNDN